MPFKKTVHQVLQRQEAQEDAEANQEGELDEQHSQEEIRDPDPTLPVDDWDCINI